MRTLFLSLGLCLAMAVGTYAQLDLLYDYFIQLGLERKTLCTEADGSRMGPKTCMCDNVAVSRPLYNLGSNTSILEHPFDKAIPVVNGKIEVNLFLGPHIFTCSPGECTCSNGQLVSARAPEMLVVENTCADAGGVEGCICDVKRERGKTPPPGAQGVYKQKPWPLDTFFFDCRPTHCKCRNNGEMRPVTGFGCRNGGATYCNFEDDFGCYEGPHPKDTADKVTVPDKLRRRNFINHKTNGTCVCSGRTASPKFPVCRSKLRKKDDNLLPLCPDGSFPDFTLGSPGSGLSECELPEAYATYSASFESNPGKKAAILNAKTVADIEPELSDLSIGN